MRRSVVEIALLVIFLITAVTFIIRSVDEIEREARLSSGASLQTVLNTVHEAIHLWTLERKKDAQTLARLPGLETFLARYYQNHLDMDELQETVGDLLKPMVELNNLPGYVIISPDFTRLACSGDGKLGKNSFIAKHHADLLANVLKGQTVTIPVMISSAGQASNTAMRAAVMYIAAPIKNAHGQVSGILAIELDPVGDFSRITGLGRLGQSGETYAFNNEGIMLSESRFNEQLYRIGMLDPDHQSVLNVAITDPGVNLLEKPVGRYDGAQKPLTVMARSAIEGGSGINTEGYHDYRGVTVFGVWHWIDELGVGLTTEIDADEALKFYAFARNVEIISTVSIATVSLMIMLYLIYTRRRMEQALGVVQASLEATVDERTQTLQERNQDLREQVKERLRSEERLLLAQRELEQVNGQLKDLALKDGLTELFNRRAFDEYLQSEWARCRAQATPLAVIFIDVDHFKDFNDNYGHAAGDSCLKKVAKRIRASASARPSGDFVARYGGEEFVAILSGANEHYASLLADCICNDVAGLLIRHEWSAVEDVQHVTVSLGVVSEIPADDDFRSVLERADAALYQAKQRGRNQVVVASELGDD